MIALEGLKEIPFEVKRVYYIYAISPGAVRGLHAHKDLKQLYVCMSGSCDVYLDDGRQQQTISLTGPNEAIYFDGQVIWREITNFSSGAVLLVLASELYDPDDYIKDYQSFLTFRGE